MKVNRKLIKYKQSQDYNYNLVKKDNYSFSIIIPTSSSRFSQLYDCLHYLNCVSGIQKCEIIIVIYENDYYEFNNDFDNIKLNIFRSKRNNNENKFCLSHARNIGLIRAKYDWVLLLDCDIFVNKNLYNILYPCMFKGDNIIYITNRINIKSNKNRSDIDIIKNDVVSINEDFTGFFQFYNRITLINRIGGYDERYLMWGREDCDFIMRAGMAGIKIKKIICPVYHILHEYEKEWKDDKCDDINYKLQYQNLEERNIKMTNIGNIIDL